MNTPHILRPTGIPSTLLMTLVSTFIVLLILTVGCSGTDDGKDPGASAGPDGRMATLDVKTFPAMSPDEVLDMYFLAIERNDFNAQKALTTGDVQEFTKFKEMENLINGSADESNTVSDNKMKQVEKTRDAYIYKGEVTIATAKNEKSKVRADLHRIADPILKASKRGWLIEDYKRDGKKMTDSVLQIDRAAKTTSFQTTLYDLFLLPKRTIAVVQLTNTFSDDVQTSLSGSQIRFGSSDTTLPIQTGEKAYKRLGYIEQGDTVTSYIGFDAVSQDAGTLQLVLQLTEKESATFVMSPSLSKN